MLLSLSIKNLAVIKHVEVEFGEGVNVLTGETGAGKSIIVEAINLLSGRRADYDMIRSGEDTLVVEATFSPGEGEKDILKEKFGLDCDDELILRRELSASGRSKAYVQGRAVPLSMLRELLPLLVDIHSQFSTQALLRPAEYLYLLDRYIGISDRVRRFADRYDEYIRVKRKVEKLQSEKERINDELEMYEYQLKELSSLPLDDIDEEDLRREFARLENLLDIKERLSTAASVLLGDDKELGVVENLFSVRKTLSEVAVLDRNVERMVGRIYDLSIELKELANDMLSYHSGLYLDEEKLQELKDMVDRVELLKKRYNRPDVRGLLEYRDSVRKRLEEIASLTSDYSGLLDKMKELENWLDKEAHAISGVRKNSAENLAVAIEMAIRSLAMEKASFKVDVSPAPLGRMGVDKVDFVVSTNVGQEFLSVSKVASGGELSRIMLAIKSVLAEVYGVPTLVFDEIDIGIGGVAVSAVADRIRDIGMCRQVIMITHHPRLAAIADKHFRVLKHEDGDRTFVEISSLDTEDERVEEISRMLGGRDITPKVVEHAKELVRMGRKR